jgi:hypothetical protein
MSKITPDTLTITRDGKTFELFMSFGILNELLPVVGDINRLAQIAIDTQLRKEVLSILFSDRDENGVVTKPLNMFTLRVTPDDIQIVCGWVASHCLDFFLGAIEKVVETHSPFKERFQGETP